MPTLEMDTLFENEVFGTLGLYVEQLSTFEKIIMVDDMRDSFMDSDVFGVQVAYYHSLVDKWETYVALDGSNTVEADLDAVKLKVTHKIISFGERLVKYKLKRGDKCIMRGITYFVENPNSDERGRVFVDLKVR